MRGTTSECDPPYVGMLPGVILSLSDYMALTTPYRDIKNSRLSASVRANTQVRSDCEDQSSMTFKFGGRLGFQKFSRPSYIIVTVTKTHMFFCC